MAQTREEKNAKRREKRARERAERTVDALVEMTSGPFNELVYAAVEVTTEPTMIDYTLIEGRPIVMTVEPVVNTARQARGRKYDGSLAQRIDSALKAGGTLVEMAASLGVKKGQISACAKIRAASGKWALQHDGDRLQLVAV